MRNTSRIRLGRGQPRPEYAAVRCADNVVAPRARQRPSGVGPSRSSVLEQGASSCRLASTHSIHRVPCDNCWRRMPYHLVLTRDDKMPSGGRVLAQRTVVEDRAVNGRPVTNTGCTASCACRNDGT